MQWASFFEPQHQPPARLAFNCACRGHKSEAVKPSVWRSKGAFFFVRCSPMSPQRYFRCFMLHNRCFEALVWNEEVYAESPARWRMESSVVLLCWLLMSFGVSSVLPQSLSCFSGIEFRETTWPSNSDRRAVLHLVSLFALDITFLSRDLELG